MLTLCCICSKESMIKAKVMIENNYHVICDECSKKYVSFRHFHEKSASLMQKETPIIPFTPQNDKIDCIFCNKTHLFDFQKKVPQNVAQKENCLNSCCICI